MLFKTFRDVLSAWQQAKDVKQATNENFRLGCDRHKDALAISKAMHFGLDYRLQQLMPGDVRSELPEAFVSFLRRYQAVGWAVRSATVTYPQELLSLQDVRADRYGAGLIDRICAAVTESTGRTQ